AAPRAHRVSRPGRGRRPPRRPPGGETVRRPLGGGTGRVSRRAALRGACRAFVTACFMRRRKQLRNVLVAATGRAAAQVSAGLAALDLDPAARPETLGPEV